MPRHLPESLPWGSLPVRKVEDPSTIVAKSPPSDPRRASSLWKSESSSESITAAAAPRMKPQRSRHEPRCWHWLFVPPICICLLLCEACRLRAVLLSIVFSIGIAISLNLRHGDAIPAPAYATTQGLQHDVATDEPASLHCGQ